MFAIEVKIILCVCMYWCERVRKKLLGTVCKNTLSVFKLYKKYVLVIQIEFRGQGYGTEWMDWLTELLWSSSCLATLPSHWCTNPVRGFLRHCSTTQKCGESVSPLHSNRPHKSSGGVSGCCTESSIRVYICNASRR